jgi:hypothetical protein
MRTRLWMLNALLALSVASTAAAQARPGAAQAPSSTATSTGTSDQPTFEVGLGYQVVRAGEICFDDDEEDCGSAQTFPLGFAIDGIRNFGRLGVVGEVGWSRDSDDLSIGVDQGTSSQNAFHYAAGLRVTGHNPGRFWPYGQVLVGGMTVRSSVDFDDEQLEDLVGGSQTKTRFIIQPGVGATVIGGDGWGVFGQVDYRRVFLKEDDDGASGRNDIRVFFGLRVIME